MRLRRCCLISCLREYTAESVCCGDWLLRHSYCYLSRWLAVTSMCVYVCVSACVEKKKRGVRGGVSCYTAVLYLTLYLSFFFLGQYKARVPSATFSFSTSPFIFSLSPLPLYYSGLIYHILFESSLHIRIEDLLFAWLVMSPFGGCRA